MLSFHDFDWVEIIFFCSNIHDNTQSLDNVKQADMAANLTQS